MSSMIGSLTPQCKQALALPLLFMLSSAGINASTYWLQNIEAQSPYNPACSLSTLVRCRYRHHPKTRYWWVANPCQTGFAPVRLLALRLGAQSRFVSLQYRGIIIILVNSAQLPLYGFLLNPQIQLPNFLLFESRENKSLFLPVLFGEY